MGDISVRGKAAVSLIVKEDALSMGILGETPAFPPALLPANTRAPLLALILKSTQEWKNTAQSSSHLISEESRTGLPGLEDSKRLEHCGLPGV